MFNTKYILILLLVTQTILTDKIEISDGFYLHSDKNSDLSDEKVKESVQAQEYTFEPLSNHSIVQFHNEATEIQGLQEIETNQYLSLSFDQFMEKGFKTNEENIEPINYIHIFMKEGEITKVTETSILQTYEYKSFNFVNLMFNLELSRSPEQLPEMENQSLKEILQKVMDKSINNIKLGNIKTTEKRCFKLEYYQTVIESEIDTWKYFINGIKAHLTNLSITLPYFDKKIEEIEEMIQNLRNLDGFNNFGIELDTPEPKDQGQINKRVKQILEIINQYQKVIEHFRGFQKLDQLKEEDKNDSIIEFQQYIKQQKFQSIKPRWILKEGAQQEFAKLVFKENQKQRSMEDVYGEVLIATYLHFLDIKQGRTGEQSSIKVLEQKLEEDKEESLQSIYRLISLKSIYRLIFSNDNGRLSKFIAQCAYCTDLLYKPYRSILYNFQPDHQVRQQSKLEPFSFCEYCNDLKKAKKDTADQEKVDKLLINLQNYNVKILESEEFLKFIILLKELRVEISVRFNQDFQKKIEEKIVALTPEVYGQMVSFTKLFKEIEEGRYDVDEEQADGLNQFLIPSQEEILGNEKKENTIVR